MLYYTLIAVCLLVFLIAWIMVLYQELDGYRHEIDLAREANFFTQAHLDAECATHRNTREVWRITDQLLRDEIERQHELRDEAVDSRDEELSRLIIQNAEVFNRLQIERANDRDVIDALRLGWRKTLTELENEREKKPRKKRTHA